MPELAPAIQEKYANWASPKQLPKRSSLDSAKFDKAGTIGAEKRTTFTGIQSGERFPQQGLIVDLAGKKEYDRLFSKEWLIDEVVRERQQPVEPGETPWYHLAGTGFWVKEQVSQLLRNVSNAGRESFPDVLERELSKVKVDIIAFEHEYLKQMISLRWNLAWGEKDGQQRVLAPDYGNALWSDVTSEDEREGAVYEALFGPKKEQENTGGVEDWLRTAPVDSFAIVVSPKGWSGLKDAAGRNITYPESQIYAVRKVADGSLQAHAFRTDATIDQNEAFQRSLGLSVEKSSSPKERIKNAVKNVALITPEDARKAESEGRKGIRSFEDIIDASEDAFDGGKEKYEEMRAIVRYPERFSQIHPLTEKLIARGQDFIRWRVAQGGMLKDIETDLQIALATIPTQLHRLYREEKEFGITQDNGLLTEAGAARRLWEYTVGGGMNYGQAKKELEAMPGCANGISDKVKVTSMGQPRNGEAGGFTCPKCQKAADGPVGDTCPNCGITKDEFVSQGGEAC